MKKILVSIFLFLVLVANGYGETSQDTSEYTTKIYKDKYRVRVHNGHFFDKDKEKVITPFYIMGAIECANALDPERLSSLYGKKTGPEILNEVFAYYERNPSEKRRPIVDVILTGCKDDS